MVAVAASTGTMNIKASGGVTGTPGTGISPPMQTTPLSSIAVVKVEQIITDLFMNIGEGLLRDRRWVGLLQYLTNGSVWFFKMPAENDNNNDDDDDGSDDDGSDDDDDDHDDDHDDDDDDDMKMMW